MICNLMCKIIRFFLAKFMICKTNKQMRKLEKKRHSQLLFVPLGFFIILDMFYPSVMGKIVN